MCESISRRSWLSNLDYNSYLYWYMLYSLHSISHFIQPIKGPHDSTEQSMEILSRHPGPSHPLLLKDRLTWSLRLLWCWLGWTLFRNGLLHFRLCIHTCQRPNLLDIKEAIYSSTIINWVWIYCNVTSNSRSPMDSTTANQDKYQSKLHYTHTSYMPYQY